MSTTPGTTTTQRWAAEPEVAAVAPEDAFAAGLTHHHLATTAYPIAHRATIWRYRRERDEHATVLGQAFSGARAMSLYAHLPFCERRCAFCEYCVVDHHDEAAEAAHHRALLAELELYDRLLGFADRELVGFDLGGGTPSLVEPRRIAELVAQVTGRFRLAPGFAMSIETTPKIAATRPERLASYRAAGIDRISMGLQMVNPALLHRYGRDLNTVGHNLRAAANIRRAGFTTFNIDVMYGFAHQTADDVRVTLASVVQLGPEVVTLYRMRYKGTRLAGEAAAIDHARVTVMARAAREVLEAAGYRAAPGKNAFSRVPDDPGTSAYLTARVVDSVPYLGLGLGAQTFTNSVLAYNLGAASKRLDGYLSAVADRRLPLQDLYLLPRSEAMAKMVAVSFYFGAVDLAAFRRDFADELEEPITAELGLDVAAGA